MQGRGDHLYRTLENHQSQHNVLMGLLSKKWIEGKNIHPLNILLDEHQELSMPNLLDIHCKMFRPSLSNNLVSIL